MRFFAPLAVLALIACAGEPESTSVEAPADEAPATEAPAAEINTVDVDVDEDVLKKADAADGTEDHVVGQCGSCSLGMDGKPEHAVKVGDYELHFCSESCATRMETDSEAVMQGVKKAVEDS